MARAHRASFAIALAVLAAGGVFSAGAMAQTTIGQVAPVSPAPATCRHGPLDVVQASVSDGTSYVVPGPGVLTSWSTSAAVGENQILKFKVFRPIMPGVFLVLGHDARTLTPGVVNTFRIDIPVQAGDVIGLDDGNASEKLQNACLFAAGAADVTSTLPKDGGDQATIAQVGEDGGARVNVSATLLAPPIITALSGAQGSIDGGARVVLEGSNFAEVSAVSFGGVPASSFTVDSENQITAVAPPSGALASVGIAVRTAAGSADAPSLFSYQGCLVPKLTGTRLRAAKTRLEAAGCKLGKVKKVKGSRKKAGRVLKQSPKPGSLLAPGSEVGAKVGR